MSKKRPAKPTATRTGKSSKKSSVTPPTRQSKQRSRKIAEPPQVTRTTKKTLFTTKTMGLISIVIAASFASLWLFTPYINLITTERSYSLASYNIIATYENTTDVTSLIHRNDGNSLTLQSSRVAEPFTYDATYSFTDEQNGRHAVNGWVSIGHDPVVMGSVGSVGPHTKVLDLFNTSVSTSISPIVTGAIEFWVYINESSIENTFMELYNNYDLVVSLRTENFSTYTRLYAITETQTQPLMTIAHSLWYRMCLWVTNGIMEFVVDGERRGSPAMIGAVDKIIVLHQCFDAIGISSSGYKPGANALPVKQFLLRADFRFSLSVVQLVEEIVFVSVIVTCPSYNCSSIVSLLHISSNGETYKLIDISDAVAVDGTSFHFTVQRYKDFLIRPGISMLMIEYSDSITSIALDYLSLSVSVII